MSIIDAQKAIPTDLGVGGAHLAKGGASGSPDLPTLLGEHKAALEALEAALGALGKVQAISGTLAGGTCTINAGITVTALSRAIVVPSAAITGTTNFGCLAHLIGSNVVGAPGAGSIIIRALGDDGAQDVDAAGTFHGILIG